MQSPSQGAAGPCHPDKRPTVNRPSHPLHDAARTFRARRGRRRVVCQAAVQPCDGAFAFLIFRQGCFWPVRLCLLLRCHTSATSVYVAQLWWRAGACHFFSRAVHDGYHWGEKGRWPDEGDAHSAQTQREEAIPPTAQISQWDNPLLRYWGGKIGKRKHPQGWQMKPRSMQESNHEGKKEEGNYDDDGFSRDNVFNTGRFFCTIA